MAFLIPLFIIIGVVLAVPQIGIGLLIVGVGAGISAATSRLLLGRSVSRWPFLGRPTLRGLRITSKVF
jgi:hypothetical protein